MASERTDFIAKTKLSLYQSRILYDHRPVTADIFLTDFCNLKCPHCKYPKGKNYMAMEDAEKFFVRLKELGVKGLVITGGGEPTLHPQFGEILKTAERLGLPYGLNTNWIKAQKCKPTFLKMSIDAWNREEYIKRKGADRFDTVIKNLANVRKYVPQDTVIGVQLIVSDIGQIWPFYSRFAGTPEVRYITIRPYENPYRVWYSFEQLSTIKQELASLNHSEGIYPHYKWGHLGKPYGDRCPANFSQIALWPNGDVMYCCNKPTEILGNVMDDDILEKREAWKSHWPSCEIPCRLSGHNEYVLQFDGDILHPQFI